jgi:polyhydroxybutyrate depolymerase
MNSALLAIAFFWGASAADTLTVSVNGVERSSLVFAPAKSASPSPLVFCFHGHGGSSRQASNSFRMHEAWPEAIVVYPQGLPSKGRTDPEGKRNGWQRSPGDIADRDLEFFDALLVEVKKSHKVDSSRIYAMGHSNGGRFTYVLWAARPDVFAAFGPSGSPATGLLFRLKPKPAFHIAGEKDPLVPYSEQKPTLDALRRLITDGNPGKTSSEGYLSRVDGPNGLEFDTYVHPGGHEFPRAAVPLMVAFFKRHAKA